MTKPKRVKKLKYGEVIRSGPQCEDVPPFDGKPYPLSDFPDRPTLEAYFGHIGTVLPEKAQAACLRKCDPEHLEFDSVFREISLRSAKNAGAK